MIVRVPVLRMSVTSEVDASRVEHDGAPLGLDSDGVPVAIGSTTPPPEPTSTNRPPTRRRLEPEFDREVLLARTIGECTYLSIGRRKLLIVICPAYSSKHMSSFPLYPSYHL